MSLLINGPTITEDGSSTEGHHRYDELYTRSFDRKSSDALLLARLNLDAQTICMSFVIPVYTATLEHAGDKRTSANRQEAQADLKRVESVRIGEYRWHASVDGEQSGKTETGTYRDNCKFQVSKYRDRHEYVFYLERGFGVFDFLSPCFSIIMLGDLLFASKAVDDRAIPASWLDRPISYHVPASLGETHYHQ